MNEGARQEVNTATRDTLPRLQILLAALQGLIPDQQLRDFERVIDQWERNPVLSGPPSRCIRCLRELPSGSRVCHHCGLPVGSALRLRWWGRGAATVGAAVFAVRVAVQRAGRALGDVVVQLTR